MRAPTGILLLLLLVATPACGRWTCGEGPSRAAGAGTVADGAMTLWTLSAPEAATGELHLRLVSVKERTSEVGGLRRETPQVTVEVRWSAGQRSLQLVPGGTVDVAGWRLSLEDAGVARREPEGPEQGFARVRALSETTGPRPEAP